MCKYWIYLSCLPIYLCVFIHMFSDKEPASESNNDVHRASYLLVFSYSERTHTSSNKNTHVSFVKYKYTSHSSNTNTSLIDRHVFSFSFHIKWNIVQTWKKHVPVRGGGPFPKFCFFSGVFSRYGHRTLGLPVIQ